MILTRVFLSDQKISRAESPWPQPEISIILPTYSRCKKGMLERSIQSVLAQTFADFELLVMDDSSIDGSHDLIEAYRAKDARVIHVRHERNSGIHSIRMNEGIKMARGKYLTFQFDDNVWLPNAL